MVASDRLAGEDVLLFRQGRLGRIRLNRPRAINALTHGMVVAVREQLEEWAHDDRVTAVAVDGVGDRGLCAGGDVRAIREAAAQGRVEEALAFWDEEYRLNALIHDYRKPYVALMDGVVMGGGVGVSAYGRLRLVTERSRVAMPETAIGFFPDVGALWLLSRAPGELGTHLALTGSTVGAADAITCGLADAAVASGCLPLVVAHLADGGPVDDAVAAAREGTDPPGGEDPAGHGILEGERSWIDSCYAGEDPAAILTRLKADPAPGARAAASVLESRSPLSVAVTLEALRRAGRMSNLAEVLDQDRRLGRAFLTRGSDFAEGVRSVLVDRDGAPHWRHASLDDVDPAEVRALFSG